jgi:hypothetical protein
MPKWTSFLATLAMAFIALGSASRAQEVSVPADTKFVVRLDLQAIHKSAIGGKLLEMARQQAMKELGGKEGPSLEKIKEMLGFDPFQEVHGITVSASDYEHPEQSLVASIRLQKTTGNLEGLLLGLPGYEAKDYGKHPIYSVAPDGDMRVFGAVHTGAQGEKTIVLSVKSDAVTNLLDQLDGKSASGGSPSDKSPSGGALKKISDADGKSLVRVDVFELPKDVLDADGPQANIVKLLRKISVQVSESGENLDVNVSLTTDTEKLAEQLRQMAQGLIAALDIAQSIDPEEQELKRIRQIAHDIKATRDGSTAKIQVSLSGKEVMKLIAEELGDD